MKIINLWLVAALLFVIAAAHAEPVNTNMLDNEAGEHIVWRRLPIKITLPINQERLITFPSEVQFGYDETRLSASVLRVENDNHTLYLQAYRPFATERVQVKLATGEVILLDLRAANGGNKEPLNIVLPKQDTNHSSTSTEIGYTSLMRYAIQQLYAPERLLTNSATITRFPMATKHVVPLFFDKSASAMPLASWWSHNHYVTAVLVKNLLTEPLALDPRVLCGEWQAASFYPLSKLSPQGDLGGKDSSTLFVISSTSFSESIQTCLNQE